MHREAADLLGDLRRGGDERVVVVQIEPEDARRLRCAEPTGVKDSERDRHLPEHVAGIPLSDHAVDAVGAPVHRDPALEQSEQCALVAFVHDGLAWNESDVRDHAGKPVALGLVELREHLDPTDLLRRHHETAPPLPVASRISRA